MRVLVDGRLWAHPKLARLAELLGRNPTEAGGYLVRLWSWAAEYRLDGSLRDLSDKELALACGWRGAPGKFIRALNKSGWVKDTQVHDWQEHQGRYIDKMLKEREKKRVKRARDREETGGGQSEDGDGDNLAPSPPSGSVSGSGSLTGSGTGPSSLPEAEDGPLPPPPKPLPPSAPAEHRLYRKAKDETKLAGKPDTLRSYVSSWLARIGEERLTAMLSDPDNRGLSIMEFQESIVKRNMGEGLSKKIMDEIDRRDAAKKTHAAGIDQTRGTGPRRLA